MLWSMDNLPEIAKGKSEEQIKACLVAIEKALERDPTDEEAALLSGLNAMRVVYKKTMPQKAPNATSDSVKPKPNHVPTFKAKEANTASTDAPEPLVKLPPLLKGHSLPQGKDRNVIAANFDTTDRLVILFDTGEKITTSSIDVKNYIEQNVSVQGGGDSNAYTKRDVYEDTITTSADQLLIVRGLATVTLHAGEAGVVEAPIRIKRRSVNDDVTITDVDDDGYILNINNQSMDVQWIGTEWIGL